MKKAMRIAIDFDGTVVVQEGRAYDDITTPLEFIPGAREALQALKDAGHILILCSARANLALREDWERNPGWAGGKLDTAWWHSQRHVNRDRYRQMVRFVDENLPGIFTYIDNGYQGKIMADMFIDDRNYPPGPVNWEAIAREYADECR